MTLEIKIISIITWFALLFYIEKRKPAIESPFNAARMGKNGSFWLFNSLVSLVVVLPLTAWAAHHALWQRDGAFDIGLILDIIVLDGWIYAWHRANHTLPFLWRFHEVHHLDAQLDTTTAVRFHFGEVLLSALVRMPVIMLLAIPFAHVLLFEMLVLAHTLFHHANIALPDKWEVRVRRFIITPAMHRMHHHNKQCDTDSNYGTILSMWDVVFRTRNVRSFQPGMHIGVEGRCEKKLVPLWLSPFMVKVGEFPLEKVSAKTRRDSRKKHAG